MASVDTLGIADLLARDGVFPRQQAARRARVSGRALPKALVTTADLETVTPVIRTEIALLRKNPVGARHRGDRGHGDPGQAAAKRPAERATE